MREVLHSAAGHVMREAVRGAALTESQEAKPKLWLEGHSNAL